MTVTPREALLAYAEDIRSSVHGDAGTWAWYYVDLAREHADRYPAGPPDEHTCGVDPDEERRAHALHIAAVRLQGITSQLSPIAESTIAVAAKFEAWLRGGNPS